MLDTIFLKRLIKMYEEALLTIHEKEEWLRNNPDKRAWEYKSEVASKSKVKRLGIMIRQELISIEKEM